MVEGDYPDLFRSQPGRGSWLADMLGRLAVRYPEVPIVFAGSRRFAEEWTYRFFGAAVGDAVGIAESAAPVGPHDRVTLRVILGHAHVRHSDDLSPARACARG